MNWEWFVYLFVSLGLLLYGVWRAITAPNVNGHSIVRDDDEYYEEYNSYGERKV